MATLEPDATLLARANHRCELCGATSDLARFDVPPEHPAIPDRAVLVCPRCAEAAANAAAPDPKQSHGLREAIWSEIPAVQVAAWRLLNRLPGEAWARDLLDQVYLDEALQEWAKEDSTPPDHATLRVLDSNGAELREGDAVTLIKDLDVKGAGFTAKRGTVVKNIHLGDDPAHVEGKVNGIGIVLKTAFLKKVV